MFTVRLVASTSLQLKDKIVLTLDSANKVKNWDNNPLYFGSTAWYNEPYLYANVTVSGKEYRTLKIQPAYSMKVNCPIFGIINIQ